MEAVLFCGSGSVINNPLPIKKNKKPFFIYWDDFGSITPPFGDFFFKEIIKFNLILKLLEAEAVIFFIVEAEAVEKSNASATLV